MDTLLANRYRLLFQFYEGGDSGNVASLKNKIASWNREHGGRLRWDAALFLLTNLDQLLARPYSGSIMDDSAKPLPLPGKLDAIEWFNKIQDAADLVLANLPSTSAEISAHNVMQTIDSNWQALTISFFWW